MTDQKNLKALRVFLDSPSWGLQLSDQPPPESSAAPSRGLQLRRYSKAARLERSIAGTSSTPAHLVEPPPAFKKTIRQRRSLPGLGLWDFFFEKIARASPWNWVAENFQPPDFNFEYVFPEYVTDIWGFPLEPQPLFPDPYGWLDFLKCESWAISWLVNSRYQGLAKAAPLAGPLALL